MNDKIRKVLEAVAKGPTYEERGHGYHLDLCVFCHEQEGLGHKDDCPVLAAQGLLKDTHPHLSDEQREEILDRAIAVRVESCEEDGTYLFNTVRDLACLDDIGSLLKSVSMDSEERKKILWFNPETGEENEE